MGRNRSIHLSAKQPPQNRQRCKGTTGSSQGLAAAAGLERMDGDQVIAIGALPHQLERPLRRPLSRGTAQGGAGGRPVGGGGGAGSAGLVEIAHVLGCKGVHGTCVPYCTGELGGGVRCRGGQHPGNGSTQAMGRPPLSQPECPPLCFTKYGAPETMEPPAQVQQRATCCEDDEKRTPDVDRRV